MDRRAKILHALDRDGLGIEIGASHHPVAPKREGFRVHVIDTGTRQQLIEKYRDHGVNLDAIEEVDFVWAGEPYAALCGKRKHYDWIIASHVIEHTPDLVGFLNDCDDVLKDDGVVSLVIPDKRYCFDHFRPISSLSRVIDGHLAHHRIHSAGTVAEYFLNVVSRAGAISWSASSEGEYRFVHTVDEALGGMRSVREDAAYLDVHGWCFVPSSFRLLIEDLGALDLIRLREVGFFGTEGNEFYVTLGRQGRGTGLSRLALLERIEAELKAEPRAADPIEIPTPQRFATLGRRVDDIIGRVARMLARSS